MEQEILILKEKCGSSLDSFKTYYVKPTNQHNIVVVNTKSNLRWTSSLKGLFQKIFLPQGYPNSVSSDYISYQIWDTVQAFCSTITGTLAMQNVFQGVGVGDTAATPLAATVTWVIKDGSGHIGKILFAYSHGIYLDAYSKKWRLYADILNDMAMCIEIALPLYTEYTMIALCISTVMKSIVGVAGGATRAALTQHHAVQGNMADVSAKDSAQETAVNLVASLVALTILTAFGNSLLIFFMMIALHIVANYYAVNGVCLKTLNEPRFLLIIDSYLNSKKIPEPEEVNRNEPIFNVNNLDKKCCGSKIKLGVSLKSVLAKNISIEFIVDLVNLYKGRNYIIFPRLDANETCVLIEEDATPVDILCAYYHAVIISLYVNTTGEAIHRLRSESKPSYELLKLRDASNIKNHNENEVSNKNELSISDLKLIKDTIKYDWNIIQEKLDSIGWDLSKHLLIQEEWRFCKDSMWNIQEIENLVSAKN